jgi:hypothetical protein
VKFIGRHETQFAFELSAQEKSLLCALLQLFPLTPVTHPRLDQNTKLPAAEAETNRRLLAEALSSRKAESKKWVLATLAGTDHFKPGNSGFYFTLQRPEMETLLQVLNDVRIGSWLTLGSPDTEKVQELLMDPRSALHVHRLEIAGWFEMFFLRSIRESDKE